jgi:membrane protein implicated in regulation of membrane protease activity
MHSIHSNKLLDSGILTIRNKTMNTKTIIYFGLSLISVVVALIIFFRGLDIKALLFLIFGVAAVLLFRQGLTEMNKKKE